VSNNLLVQYVGFETRAGAREYTFRVKDASEEAREFTLTIGNDAFVSHRARYQDAPSICALRLHAELSTSANHPSETHYRISDAELDSYREAHSPKPPRGLYKPRTDNEDS
jgi:hypothetical protein